MDIAQLLNAPNAANTIMPRNAADEVPDGEVASIKPVASITHEETGFSGPDFVPGKPIKRVATKLASATMDDQIYAEPTDEDYIPPVEAARRNKIREELAKKYKAAIMADNAQTMEKYNKAQTFITAVIAKYGSVAGVKDEAILDKYRRALDIVNGGKPIDEKEADRRARYKASTEAVGKEA
jgi:hypothetical protein